MNIKNFTLIGRAEGISSLLLFFIAMPMKYVFDMAWAVKYTGWAHGLLFVIFLGALAMIALENKWKFTSILLMFIAAIIPGGPLYLEKYILRREGEA